MGTATNIATAAVIASVRLARAPPAGRTVTVPGHIHTSIDHALLRGGHPCNLDPGAAPAYLRARRPPPPPPPPPRSRTRAASQPAAGHPMPRTCPPTCALRVQPRLRPAMAACIGAHTRTHAPGAPTTPLGHSLGAHNRTTRSASTPPSAPPRPPLSLAGAHVFRVRRLDASTPRPASVDHSKTGPAEPARRAWTSRAQTTNDKRQTALAPTPTTHRRRHDWRPACVPTVRWTAPLCAARRAGV
jgi:hypothetical protein